MKYYLFLLIIFFSNSLICQDDTDELDFLFPGDSIPTNSFMLDEVTVFQEKESLTHQYHLDRLNYLKKR